MNRVANWILGTISGLILALTALSFPAMAGVGVSSSCVSINSQSCTPTVDQVMVSLPNLTGASAFPLMLALLAILIGLPAWIATPILALRRGSSARTAILVVAVVASAILIVSVILLSVNMSQYFSAPQVCLSGGDPQAQTCFTGDQQFWVTLVGIWWAPIGLALLLSAPAWVMTLTQTARLRQWGWFVFALLFSPIAALLYAFLGASKPANPTPVTPTPAPALS